MGKNLPFLLRPSGKDYIWGGSRLKDDFEKNIDMTPLAETWECSVHPDGPSYAASGEFEGKSLKDILELRPEYLGSKHNELEILIKFIDAKNDLSVQVHPSDEYAMENEGGQQGKTEMWYILDATEDTRLVYGLKRECTREAVLKALEDGTIENKLQYVKVKKGDLFFIKPGTIHAIGGGALIAEIQENSNLTYRMYDYHRVDASGKERPLHIEKALAVADLKGMSEPKQPLRVLKYKPGLARELLCSCQYFEVYRMLVNTERRQDVKYKADEMSFRVLLCVGGCGSINFENTSISFFKGDCIFVPAASVEFSIHGRSEFLDING